MKKIIAAVFAAGALLLAPSCATANGQPAGAVSAGAVKILGTDQMFSAADWTPDVEAALRAAGWGDRLEQVKAHMNETDGGWPKNLANGETRHFQGDAAVKLYNAVEVARFSFYDQDAVLLHISAARNQHMAEGWRPTEDFFLIMGAPGVAKAG